MNKVLVAEIFFDREASPEKLSHLGKTLEQCIRENEWIDCVGGLNDLLKGACPELVVRKATFDRSTGVVTPIAYDDTLLVWARLDYPDKEKISPQKILGEALKSTIGHVRHPDPDGGL